MIVAEKQEISLQFATELEQIAHEITVCFDKSEGYQITAGKKLRRARELCGTKLEFEAWYEREIRGGTPTFPKYALSYAYKCMAWAGHEEPEAARAHSFEIAKNWDRAHRSSAQNKQNQGVTGKITLPPRETREAFKPPPTPEDLYDKDCPEWLRKLNRLEIAKAAVKDLSREELIQFHPWYMEFSTVLE